MKRNEKGCPTFDEFAQFIRESVELLGLTSYQAAMLVKLFNDWMETRHEAD